MAEPFPICHLNGELLELRAARISPLDRSFLFGDGVYEVVPVYGGRPFRFAQHLERLARSCREIRLREPLDREGWTRLCRELLARNRITDQDAYLYIQISRGAESGRNHAPLPQIAPTLFAFCTPWVPRRPEVHARGLAAVTAPDLRWGRCDIKSVNLLGNILARDAAISAGASEAILLRDGQLTEASAATVHVVIGAEVRTPPDSHRILPGTTRGVIDELSAALGIPHRAVGVTEGELRAAQEIWLSAAGREIDPVTRLDGRDVGRGVPGPLWRRVNEAFQSLKRELAGQPW